MRRVFPIFLVLTALAATLATLHAQANRSAITLAVDATEAPRKILHAREIIRVSPGPLTLLYPKWIPGEHSPTGPVVDLAGLKITAGNTTVPWRRDLDNMFAIHCVVPPGVTTLDLSFDFLLPPEAAGFSSGASSSAQLLVLSWNQVVLYPSEPAPDNVTVSASVKLPEGWQHATALTPKEVSGNVVSFQDSSLTMLVDSPLLTGAHLQKVDLTPASKVPHFLNIASDSDAALAITPKQVAGYKQLVLEADALFGAHHYDHYDFLYTLSDAVAHFGLEHHQSSDDRVSERTFLDDNLWKINAGLLPHEFVHSWNAKYRRPSGLATGDFSTPMKDDLLWVYEGLTEYLGNVLTARSGLRTPEEYRENLALLAARLDNRPGREWRSLQDTNDAAQLLYFARGDWNSLRRDVDFYDEGDLIWLEADVTIRQLTGGRRSLDDFCKAFHGGASGGPALVPYTFDDVVAALNAVAPNDWKGFFTTRLTALSPRAPIQGIEKSGWKLSYRDTPTSMDTALTAASRLSNFRYSLGIVVGEDGAITDVVPGSPAAKASIGPGMKIAAVDGRKYSSDILREALKRTKANTAAIELLVINGEFYKSHRIDYHGGERYPYLERDPSKPDLLSAIISSIAK
jgi:predicted metalloprotease with PDZ domain